MTTSTPLSGLTATVTLPPGITAQIYDCQLEEEFREGDSESFADAGYGSGVLTGQRLKGTIVGWLSQNDPGTNCRRQYVWAITLAAVIKLFSTALLMPPAPATTEFT